MPMSRSERYLLSRLGRHHVGLSAHSQTGSEDYLLPEDPQFEPLKIFQEKLDLFKRFTWPEILVAKIWIVASTSPLAAEKFSDLSPTFLVRMCQAMFAVTFMTIYIMGMNQITDIEIDKINKPHRPLVTGEYSMNTAVMIVSSSVIMSFLVGWTAGSRPLLCSLFIGFVIGTIYSVDTFVLGQPALFSKAIVVLTTFLSIFGVALALFKDIPDIKGDKLDGNKTFSVRFGAKKVYWSCIGIIQLAYLVVILAGLTYSSNWSKFMIAASHMFMACIVWSHAKSVDIENRAEIGSFYVFMWKLVSVEYLLIHLLK